MFVYLLSFLHLQLPPVRLVEQELVRKLARPSLRNHSPMLPDRQCFEDVFKHLFAPKILVISDRRVTLFLLMPPWSEVECLFFSNFKQDFSTEHCGHCGSDNYLGTVVDQGTVMHITRWFAFSLASSHQMHRALPPPRSVNQK
jgi:hypothetical protein